MFRYFYFVEVLCGLGSYEIVFFFVAKKKFKDSGVATQHTCDVNKMNKQQLVKQNIIPIGLNATKLWNMQATLCRS